MDRERCVVGEEWKRVGVEEEFGGCSADGARK
jgi:hypothetical protein